MLNRTVTFAAIVSAVWISGSAAQVLTTTPTIASSPYPKWFLDRPASAPNKLLFRMYGYEGIARNLFVLTCGDKKAIEVEIIPPKAIEELLRTTASARDRQTDISFVSDASNPYRLKGTYDKISAWAKLPTDNDLFKFLQLLHNERLRVRWHQAKIEYLLESNRVYIEQFTETFRAKLLGNQNEELSYQDVYIRCSQLWERERSNYRGVDQEPVGRNPPSDKRTATVQLNDLPPEAARVAHETLAECKDSGDNTGGNLNATVDVYGTGTGKRLAIFNPKRICAFVSIR